MADTKNPSRPATDSSRSPADPTPPREAEKESRDAAEKNNPQDRGQKSDR